MGCVGFMSQISIGCVCLYVGCVRAMVQERMHVNVLFSRMVPGKNLVSFFDCLLLDFPIYCLSVHFFTGS